MYTQNHSAPRLSCLSQAAMSIVLLTCRPGLAQSFQPFGEAHGEIQVHARFGGGETSGELEESAEFEKGRSGTLSEDGTESGPLGSAAWASWSWIADSHEIESAPLTESEAHEWSFSLGGRGQRDFSSTTRVAVEFVLLDPARVMVRAQSEGAFYSASFATFEADGFPSPLALSGRGGTLGADGVVFRELTLMPGAHRLEFEVSPVQVSGTWEEAQGTLWVRFEPARCAADLNGDGVLDQGDLQWFVTLFLAGCR